jgi:hypothetical protein
VVASRDEAENTPARPRAAARAAAKKRFYVERKLRYRHAVFCRRVEAWQRKEAMIRADEQALQAQQGIHKYLKVLARAQCTLVGDILPASSRRVSGLLTRVI